jgi:hypothetical protein
VPSTPTGKAEVPLLVDSVENRWVRVALVPSTPTGKAEVPLLVDSVENRRVRVALVGPEGPSWPSVGCR